MSADRDLVVLSPHLDDAALSCGGFIHRRVREGRRVAVLTLFACDVSEQPMSALARTVLGWMGLGTNAMAVRRDEDVEACRRLGAEALHWEYPEAIFRGEPAHGAPLYVDLADLFREPHTADHARVDEIAERLARDVAAESILAPLGVGGHVDHRLLRAAAERAWPGRLAYYEEFPYSRVAGAVASALGDTAGWKYEVATLAPADLAARCAAIAAYRSQIRPLFRSGWRMRRAVRRDVRRRGGERLWRR